MPSVAELRAKQSEATATTLRQALESDDLDDYGALLDSLSDDGDPRSIALGGDQARPRGERGDGGGARDPGGSGAAGAAT